MIVHKTLRYPVEILLPRKRSRRTVTVQETVPVELREIGSGEAPLVARFFTSSWGNERLKRSLRWHDGSFWIDQVATPYRQAHGYVSKAALVDEIEIKPALGFGGAYHDPHSIAYAPEEVPSLGPKEIYPSGRDALIQSVTEELSDELIIDGMAYERTSEPVLTWTVFGLRSDGSVGIDFLTDRLSKQANLFRLDNAAAAIEGVNSLGLMRPVEDDYVDKSYEIEILRPDLLQFDDRGRSLRMAAADALWAQDGKFLKAASIEGFKAFIELREVVEAPASDIDDVLRASKTLLQHLDADLYETRELVDEIARFERLLEEEKSFDAIGAAALG